MIYKFLFKADKPCTKLYIARSLSLSLPTVNQNIKELLDEGLIEFAGTCDSTGGRKPQAIAPVAGARFAIGIALTETRMRILALDLCLNELGYKKVHIQFENSEVFGCLISTELESFLDENHLQRAKLLGVGIAVPGVVDEKTGEITSAPTLKLRKVDSKNLLKYLKYPAFIDNDATCGGNAVWTNLQQTPRNAAYLSLEDGIGGAILTEHIQYVGSNRRSAEFGHMCVEPGGTLCKCGRQGCMEAYCSALRIHQELGVTPDYFFSVMQYPGNTKYEEVWEDMLRHLAIGINNIHMILDCDVIIGGFLAQYMQPYMDRLRRYVLELDTFSSDNYIYLSKYTSHAVGTGAAYRYIKQFILGV